MAMELPNLMDFGRIVFFTGAGLSADSGVPTYRGKGGIWQEYDYERHACQRAFDTNPEGVWAFHNYRRQLVAACAPNDGHRAITRIEDTHPNTHIITQNIDGLHQEAGAKEVIELHGSLWRVRCDETGERLHSRASPFEGKRPDGYWWRPDIVWFEDALPMHTIETAIRRVQTADILISIGTSAVVYPAAGLPLEAKKNGALLIEINPQATPISHLFDIQMRMGANEALEKISARLTPL